MTELKARFGNIVGSARAETDHEMLAAAFVETTVQTAFLPLGRIPVDGIVSTEGYGGVVRQIEQVLERNARVRLADAIEAQQHGLPAQVVAAFTHALRTDRPIRTTSSFTAAVSSSATELRAALAAASDGSHYGVKLHWFVDAALVARASEMAAMGRSQLATASHLGVSERTLARTRRRILGRTTTWQHLRDTNAVAQALWS